jgi:DNA-directed RNA polymerase subunit E"
MRACRDCHALADGDTCPQCKSTNLSKDWTGYVVVLDSKRSIIAKKMNIDTQGKYALKVR